MNTDPELEVAVLEAQHLPDRRPRIVVVGSMNMDLVARMSRLPRPGETVTGETFQTIPGGKGANQAVAAARLGADVTMIARVGDDTFGTTLRNNLMLEGIECGHVFVTKDCSSGVALIGVESSGANSIAVVPGANGRLTIDDVQSSRSLIESAQVLVVQLETPVETVAAAIEIAQKQGILTILDPAPAPSRLAVLPMQLMSVDVISPNQTEAEALTGIPVVDWDSAKAAAVELRRRGAKNVVLKMGELGALACSQDGSLHRIMAMKADVVDTTAAGDAFTAGLAIALCEGLSLNEATRWGVVAGTLACTRFGAQPAMPTRLEFERSLRQK
jgi:ribokinase